MKASYHARGKLLLTAEYFVLDGAQALALPLNKGQSMTVSINENEVAALQWQSFDEKRECWFSANFDPENFDCLDSSDSTTAARLRQILCTAKNLNPAFRLPAENCQVQTNLDFPREWGLGTSSTLIHLIARWAEVDSFELQFRTFGGSGYDVACAGANGPIFYQKKDGKPEVEPCLFNPPFSNHLYFVYLGKKQNSRQGITRFHNWQSKAISPQSLAREISALTREFSEANTLEAFDKLIVQHEALVAGALSLPRAKDLYFRDYWGEIKSLGAWGGDFVLATSSRPPEETKRYFNEKDFEVFLPYDSMALS